jgi:hypothetical protein
VDLEVVEAEGLGGEQLERLPDGEDVAEALPHLPAALHVEEAVVHPVADVGRPVPALALGHLVLVVREHQVEAAAVDVEGDPEELPGHGRALDVPARAPVAPGARPRRLALLGRLPEREVLRGPLAAHRLGAPLHLVDLLAAELAVAVEGLDAEPDVSVDGVGVAALHQHLDELDDLGHRGADPRRVRRLLEAEGGHVLVEARDEAVREIEGRLAALLGPLDDLVVDVREVADEGDVPAAVPEVAGEGVEGDHRPRVPDVAVVVDGHPTDVEADVALLLRDEVLHLSSERVVEPERGRGRHGHGLSHRRPSSHPGPPRPHDAGATGERG